jgi:hypothetical protein
LLLVLLVLLLVLLLLLQLTYSLDWQTIPGQTFGGE